MTRSLGDSPFHKDAAVSAVPGVAHVPINGAVRFAVVASDGIWDHLSNSDVVDIAAAAMKKASASALGTPGSAGDGGAMAPPGLSKQRSNGPMLSIAAAAACDAVLDRIDRGQASGELRPHYE